MRVPVGTGFFVQVLSETVPNAAHNYLLTPHHVIDGELNVEVEIANPFNEGSLHPRLPITNWQRPLPKLDLAVAPFHRPDDYGVLALQLGHNLIEDLDLVPGLQFYFVGLLAPLDRPMARSGTIGAVDQRGLPTTGYEYLAHLVDCRSYGGFSGSPCYVEYMVPGLKPAKTPVPLQLGEPVGRMAFMHLLCGMFTEHLKTAPPEDLEDEIDGRFADEIVSRYGVGVVLTSDEIWRALMTEAMRAERARIDAEAAASDEEEGSVLDPVSVPREDEFAQFEDLTRKLMQVPKEELDEKRKES